MHPSCAAKIPKLSGIIYNLTLIRWVTGGRKHSTQVYWGNAKVGLGDCEGRRKGEEGEQHLWLKRWGWRSEKERRSADQRYARWGKQQKVGGADMQQGQTHKPHSLIYVVVTLFTLYSRWGRKWNPAGEGFRSEVMAGLIRGSLRRHALSVSGQLCSTVSKRAREGVQWKRL